MRIKGDRLAITLLLPVAALALYLLLGDPASLWRTTQDNGSPTALAEHLRSQPRDARGWILLARELAAREHFAESADAYAHAVALPKAERDAAIWAEYADTLGMAQGGTLDGRPSELIAHALTLDPNQRQALELAGSAAYERGDYAVARRHWDALLAQLAPGSRQAQELAAAIERSDRHAHVRLP